MANTRIYENILKEEPQTSDVFRIKSQRLLFTALKILIKRDNQNENKFQLKFHKEFMNKLNRKKLIEFKNSFP
jgi:hypothetical protein